MYHFGLDENNDLCIQQHTSIKIESNNVTLDYMAANVS